MTNATTQSILMEVDSALANTRLVAMAMRGVCAITKLSPMEINRIELCLVEVVNNAIEHAYGNEAGHKVEVVVTLEDIQLSITISDWGAVMSEHHLGQTDFTPIDPESSASWLSSGRGLHIVRSLMDTVEYRSHQSKNSLLMVKKLRH